MCALVVYAFLHETPAETLSGFTAVADAGLGHAEDVTIGILFEARSLPLSCFMRGLGQGCSQDKG